jgi:predicted transcriptional regulator
LKLGKIFSIIYIESQGKLSKKNKSHLKGANKKIFIKRRKKIMKLTEKSMEVFNYVKENGGRVSINELVEATGRAARSINANVTDLCKKALAVREKEAGEGEDAKEITYVVLTDEGKEFVPSED